MARLILGGLGSKLLLTRGLGRSSLALPEDLVDAVVARIQARLVATGLLTWFGTGVNPGAATAPLPYGQVNEPDEDDDNLNTSGDRNADGHLEINLYAATKKRARKLGDLIEAAFDAPPAFRSGTLYYFSQSGRSCVEDPDPAPDGGSCWIETRQFEFMYSYSK